MAQPASESWTYDLERVRYVTANYDHLQGLRKAPVGLFFLLLAVVGAYTLLIWRPEGGADVPAAYGYAFLPTVVMLFVGTVVLYYRISGYYERRYGSVKLFLQVPMRRQVLIGVVVLCVFLSSSLGLLLFGMTVLIAYWPERRFQRHYVAMGALIVGYALFGMAGLYLSLTLLPGLLDVMLALGYFGRLITLSIVGLYYIVGGFLDHLLLVSTMKLLPKEGDGQAA